MNIEELKRYLRFNISSNEIYDKIIYEIIFYYENNKLNINYNSESIEVIGINKNSKKEFLKLKLKSGKIEFLISRWNGRNEEQIIVKYDNYKTTVETKELSFTTMYKTNELTAIQSKCKKQIYNNSELIYESELNKTINTNINMENEFNYTETNRIDKNLAIKKIVSLENGKIDVSYQMSNNYNEPYYNSSKNKRNVYTTYFHGIDNEEYYELLNGKQKTIKK